MSQQRKKYSCGKCGYKPDKWNRAPEKRLADFECPRCGKPHFHFKAELANELIPIGEETEEPQHVFVTCTGRKIRGIETVRDYLSGLRTNKYCRNCGEAKSDDWKYSRSERFDLICPRCGKRHLEDTKKLIPVDSEGLMQDVLIDGNGCEHIGSEEIKKAIERIKSDSE